MYVVAVVDTSISPEMIAADLGVVAYEARQRLAIGSPAIVWTGGDREQALGVLAKVRARDPKALACDTSAVIASASMISMRDFAFVQGGLSSGSELLPFDDVLCILRATQRRTAETTTTQKETNFSVGRTVLSGGLVTSKTTSREVTTKSTDREQVLYLFRRSGAVPWLLREAQTRYTALGARVAPATMQNFLTTIQLFREAMPRAIYDERLVTMRVTDMVSAAGGTDLLAHLVALTLSKSIT